MMMIRIRNVLQFGRISKLVLGVSQPRLRYLPAVLNNAEHNYSHNFMGISSQLANFSIRVNPEPISVAVTNNVKSECIELKWTGKESYQYPYLWLRDNCQCPNCYNASSKSRRLLMRDLNPESTPWEIKVSMFFHVIILRLLNCLHSEVISPLTSSSTFDNILQHHSAFHEGNGCVRQSSFRKGILNCQQLNIFD